jgi:hypothetical protein
MIRYLPIFMVVLLMSCGQSGTNKQEISKGPSLDSSINSERSADILKTDTIQKAINEKIDYQVKELSSVFKNFRLMDLKEPILADLNGDGITDKAIFTSLNGKRGILITEGKGHKVVKIGLGEAFEEMSDDFSWVDYWAVVQDSTTYEVIIIDSEINGDTIVSLEHPSIVVRKEEVGGGVITFKNGKYQWIHQAD